MINVGWSEIGNKLPISSHFIHCTFFPSSNPESSYTFALAQCYALIIPSLWYDSFGGRHKYILVCIDRSRGWLATVVMNEYHDLVPTLLLISAFISLKDIYCYGCWFKNTRSSWIWNPDWLKIVSKTKKWNFAFQYCPFVACTSTYCGITILMFAPLSYRESFLKTTWLT